MIGLLDCNNFYASCERAFNPLLRNTPVIVLSNNDGCVIARSNEAKSLGIKMGVPAFKVKNLIEKNHVHVFSSNYALYGDMSERVMNILKREVENVEVYSIDEAFLDLSQLPDKERIKSISDKVFKWTNLPVSIGVAPTKCLSKVANQIAKKKLKSGVYILEGEKNISDVLKEFPVADLWGVGRRYVKKLNKLGVNNALEFRDLSQSWVRKNMSVNGVRLQKELKGEKCFDVKFHTSPKKNIRVSRTFSNETNDYLKLQQIISTFASKASEKLRLQNSLASSIYIFIKSNRFKFNDTNYKLSGKLNFDYPTNDNSMIVKKSLKILSEIFSSEQSYKQAGVMLGDFVYSNKFQRGLFEDFKQKNKRLLLMKTFDNINLTFGSETIKLASEEFHDNWRTKRNKLSPSYTTKWNDILVVNI